MSKLFDKVKRRFLQPKWRHGRLSALLMAAFIAACVLVNVGVKALEDEYGWRRDYSFNGYATTGEETRETLSRLDKDVELYLLYQGGAEDAQVLQVLTRYTVLSERVTVIPTDIAKNPGILSRFQGNLDTAVEADSVVVNCPATGRYKVLSYQNFLEQGYNIEQGAFEVQGLAYEKQLTEAILYVTQDTIPTIGLLQGHGELDVDTLQNLTAFLKSNNYDSTARDLLAGDTLEGIDLLLIADPQKDLTEGETAAIASFAQNGGSLFVIRDYTDPIDSMPNYLSLLRSYGVVPLPGVVVAGEQDVGSYYGERIYLLPYMCELDMTLPLTSAGLDVLLLAGACAFEPPPEPDHSLTVATVLKTGPHAYLRDPSDGQSTIDKQPGDLEGELSLALYAHRMHANGNVSRMFAIGNSTLFTDEYIYQRTFNEEFIMQLMGELLPQKSVSLSIMASTAFRPALTAGSQTMGIALLIALPLLVLIVALCVLLPRKNR
ncbi:MAG: Gldg family protein [Clostridia bacterium]